MTAVLKRAWYREPYVWMVITIPLVAVVAGIAMIVIAVKSDDGLVVDDYYKKGKEINLVVARDQAAMEHGLTAQVALDGDSGQVIVQLGANPGYELPERVQLDFMFAAHSGSDQSLVLVRSDSASYRAPLPDLADGKWYLQLSTNEWRLLDSILYPGVSRLTLRPVAP